MEWGPGIRKNWSPVGVVQVGSEKAPLFFGEHPHSRQDNNQYVELNGDSIGFDGFRYLIDIKIESRNYLKTSGLSGDEVRKSVTGVIVVDGIPIYEFGRRDPRDALLEAHHLIGVLYEHASDWLSLEARKGLPGRKVFYRNHPALVDRLIVDQGCLMLRTEDGKPFPPAPWQDRDDEDEATIKVDVLDSNIWWWRE